MTVPVDEKGSALPALGSVTTVDALLAVRSVSGTPTTITVQAGTAAAKTASDNSKANVASVSGAITAGHIAVFADTAGTIADGGAVPSGGGGGITALTGDATASGTGSVAVTVTKINGQTPAAVATSGAYGDITGKPSFATVATSGAYSDLSSKPTLGTAAALAAGSANGVATLDGSTKIPAAQIPAPATEALTDAATIAWDSAIKVASVSLAGNRTLSLPSPLVAGRLALTIKQDATGGRTLAFAAGWKFPGGLAPSLSAGANAVDLLDVICDGTNVYAAMQYGMA